MKFSNVLVTGGAGFIGSNFIHYILKKYADVRIINLDKLTYAGNLINLDNLADPLRYHFIQGDICDRQLVETILQDFEIDTIVHFAAESHVDRSISDPNAFIQTNLVGTFVLLDTARMIWREKFQMDPNLCRFHHISTDEVYGTLNEKDDPFTEQSAYMPNSPYSASKAGSDHLVRAYANTYKLPVTLSNCSNNYGLRQHPEKFIPTVISACINKRPIPIYGKGLNIRDWLHVTDHCRAIELIINKGNINETYNVGADNEWRNIDLAKLICQIMDELYPHDHSNIDLISYVTDRAGHDWRYAINSNKLMQNLGWRPQEDFILGLTKTIQYYAA